MSWGGNIVFITYLNLSIQSIPFGSSFENTKQVNAALNCSPQGPCAMPPRQGQSQLISPVSSLNAPCWPASSSYSCGVRGGSSREVVGGASCKVAVELSGDESAGRAICSGEGADDKTLERRLEESDSRVWSEDSSVGAASGGMATETTEQISMEV